MTIGGISSSGTQAVQPARGQAGDALSKSLQKQIAETKQRLQEVSSNQELSMEEKMQKRQELQKQVSDLQNQLRQHELELRREAQEAQNSNMEEMLGGRREETAGQASGMPQAGMEAMLSADSALTQAKSQGSVAKSLKGDARVLEGEIKLDAARGQSSEGKQAALADIKQKAEQAAASQIKGLSEAAKQISDAVNTDSSASEETEPEDIYAQYGDSVSIEISSEAITALRNSQ